MHRRRLISLAAVLATAVTTTACFVGPACGCGSATTAGLEETVAGRPGAQEQSLAPCEPRSWDIPPQDNDGTLSIFYSFQIGDPGELLITVEAGDTLESYTLTAANEFGLDIDVPYAAGDAIAVHFAADAEAVVSWTFAVSPNVADELPVTEFEDPDAPLPEACGEAS